MPRELIFVLIMMLLGAWFLIDEKRSVVEKIFIVAAVLAIYISYRLMTGSSFDDIIAPLLSKGTTAQ
ncbi:MAG: hypothetical protein Q8Q08_08915 [Candidatus Omnitrophota bacterium]|nr:hypothetical protein [Candidatus Omnitrophota bacterium]MDZ4242640.1 hypothetical protein [Candidatus Omnitrophota bacterium]